MNDQKTSIVGQKIYGRCSGKYTVCGHSFMDITRWFLISQDFWEIKRMRKQWIPGSLSPAHREPGYEARNTPKFFQNQMLQNATLVVTYGPFHPTCVASSMHVQQAGSQFSSSCSRFLLHIVETLVYYSSFVHKNSLEIAIIILKLAGFVYTSPLHDLNYHQ